MDLEALERLARLRDNGVLTEEEFKEQKAQVLGAATTDKPSNDRSTSNAEPLIEPQAGVSKRVLLGVSLSLFLLISACVIAVSSPANDIPPTNTADSNTELAASPISSEKVSTEDRNNSFQPNNRPVSTNSTEGDDFTIQSIGGNVPIFCRDDKGVFQPVKNTTLSSLREAFTRQYGFTGVIRSSSNTIGYLTFSEDGERAGENLEYTVEPHDGGVGLLHLNVNLQGALEKLTGTKMCWQLFATINVR